MVFLSLSCADWRAELAPSLGGALLSLSHQGRAILRPTRAHAVADKAVRLAACYPMVPYVNRIAGGCFRFAGVDYRLALNFPGSPHPMHGLGWQRRWDVTAESQNMCDLALVHQPDEDWPFSFTARQRVEVGGQGLRLTLSVTNDGAEATPLGLGYHPYFSRRGGDWVRFASTGGWRNGPDMLPSEPFGGDPVWDYSSGRRTDAKSLDHDFTGWDGTAEVGADDGPSLRLTADRGFPLLRVFTPPDRDYFAVEPVSHGADAINRPGGMAVVGAGQSLSASMTIGLASP